MEGYKKALHQIALPVTEGSDTFKMYDDVIIHEFYLRFHLNII